MEEEGKVTPRPGQPRTAQVHCRLQARQEEARRDPGFVAWVCSVWLKLKAAMSWGFQPAVHGGTGREGVTKGTSTTTRERRRRAWYCMRVAALSAPVCARMCALTEEDQRCRNGQMRNSKETVGYMLDIYVSRHGRANGIVDGDGGGSKKRWQVAHTVHGTALCLAGCRVPLGRHA